MTPTAARALTGAATLVVVCDVSVAVVRRDDLIPVPLAVMLCPAILLAWFVLVRVPGSPVGPALAWCTASIGLVVLSDATGGPWAVGLWPLNLAGVLALLLVFPDGRRRGRLWSAVPWAFALATAAMVVAMWGASQVDGQVVDEPSGWRSILAAAAMATIAACLATAIASLVVRYRRGDQRTRLQIRWLMLAGVAVLVLIVAGWVLEGLVGAATTVAYLPFLLAIALVVPTAVAAAVVRYDLFDVDRVLGQTAVWIITVTLSAAVFAAVVLAVSRLVQHVTEAGPAVAAFVTALVLLPVYRFVNGGIGRIVDRDTHVAVAKVVQFAADVRAGRRVPEEVEAVLRDAQRDPDLVLVLADGTGGWVTMDGTPTQPQEGYSVEAGGDTIARIALGWESRRARRRVADLARAAWVPIEVSRLRLVLRQALEEAQASRARLAAAAAEERRRLERDLHDGAQQRIVSTGMRLRLLQERLPAAEAAEVDAAVSELKQTVAELRELANGVRPRRLDDGLEAALSAVRDAAPIPFDLVVGPLPEVDDVRLMTAFLVVSESVANALKHAQASRIGVTVGTRGERIAIEVSDDGVGGVPSDEPLPALRDRVLSVGGTVGVMSVAGRGTTISALV